MANSKKQSVSNEGIQFNVLWGSSWAGTILRRTEADENEGLARRLHHCRAACV